jgi:hypothetical protein
VRYPPLTLYCDQQPQPLASLLARSIAPGISAFNCSFCADTVNHHKSAAQQPQPPLRRVVLDRLAGIRCGCTGSLQPEVVVQPALVFLRTVSALRYKVWKIVVSMAVLRGLLAVRLRGGHRQQAEPQLRRRFADR